MFVSINDVDSILNSLKTNRQSVAARNDEPEIVAKVKEYEKQLRAEYAEKKQAELHEFDVRIEVVEQVRAMAQEVTIAR